MQVWGIPFGYKGFLSDAATPSLSDATTCTAPIAWKELDEKSVAHIHKRGGTILGSSRCVCVVVCVRERQLRSLYPGVEQVCVCVCVCVYVCVCV